MSSFRKEFDALAEAVITNALVMPAVELEEGKALPPYHYTDNACWNTGAQFTIISPRLVEALQLGPFGQGGVMGIGGDQVANTYLVHIALPDGKMIQDVEVYCSDIDDYDILLGMDIITETDFLLTNADGKTVFQFRTPSEGGMEL